ncbi:MAG: ferrous iron transport protein B [Methanomassiliicoccus sp.]|nr:ferrous iron transport protein B [Methanomassiliicoccus sp.]
MKIVLAGNLNVGKSALFSRITGIGVISANYPGTTVQFESASVTHKGQRIEVFDLPGTYSLAGVTEDERVATTLLAEKDPDYVIAVLDATRLEQGMVLVLQLIELGYRVIIALNFMDQARKRMTLDVKGLEKILQVPVVPTVALTGEGVDRLMDLAVSGTVHRAYYVTRYDSHIEAFLEEMAAGVVETESGFPIRGASIKLLENNPYFTKQFSPSIKTLADEYRKEFREQHYEDVEVHIARDRYGEAGKIASEVISWLPMRDLTVKDRISDLTLRPRTGIPILIGILVGIFLSVVVIGGFLETLIIDVYTTITGNFFDQLAAFIGGTLGAAIASGINLSIEAILAIVIPYILVFYLILGLLEDSGYLPRAVMLLDGLMVRLGLHGRAIIPMVVGTGCNVPAILATRTLESKRERLILATIIVMAVPCSAQTVIIIGTVGQHSGILWAALIYLVLLSLALILGRVLHILLREEPASLVIEIPELSMPSARNVLSKTWLRVKDFFIIAFPLLLVGSLILEALMRYNVLNALVDPLSFLTVGLLGLPAVTIVALIFGVLRKEMALQILFVIFSLSAGADLGAVLTSEQLFVFALVMATYMPCIGVFAALTKEFGVKEAVSVSIASIVLAFLLGGAANFLFSL